MSIADGASVSATAATFATQTARVGASLSRLDDAVSALRADPPPGRASVQLRRRLDEVRHGTDSLHRCLGELAEALQGYATTLAQTQADRLAAQRACDGTWLQVQGTQVVPRPGVRGVADAADSAALDATRAELQSRLDRAAEAEVGAAHRLAGIAARVDVLATSGSTRYGVAP